jgi:type I restriction enzyme S subunit
MAVKNSTTFAHMVEWPNLALAELSANTPNAIVGGPFGSDLTSKDYTAIGIPVIRGQNMGGHFVSGDFVFVSHAKAKKLQANTARPGDVIFTQRGTLGQVSIVPHFSYQGFLISQSQMKISLEGNRVASEYVYQYFISTNGQKQILDSAIQTGVPHTNLGILRAYTIPLPPLAEQEAIAGALSDADAWIESLEQLIAKKRQIKQGAMQELLTGKRRLPGFSGQWETKRLGEIGVAVAGLTYSPGDVAENGTLVLRASNVDAGTLVFQDNVFVEMDLPDRVFVRSGDILICVRNGSRDLIGKCAKIDFKSEAERHVFGAFMCVYRTDFHDFVFHQFQSDMIKRQISEHLGATINQITNKSLNSFEIPIPSKDEQTAIATVLSDMDTEIESLESKLAKAREIKQGLMQELLTGRIRLV